jgi:hypothetical protein
MKNEETIKKCFVLIPFTVKETDKTKYPDPDHWNDVYEGLIIPAANEAGLECEKDDQDIGTRLIVVNILKKIEEANIIICDLSGYNSNVFFELGWALRADKPFVLIKDDLTPYTFDLNQMHTFNYLHSLKPVELRKEIKALTEVIKHTLNDSERRYSLVKNPSLNLAIQRNEAVSNDNDFHTQLKYKIFWR